MKSLYSGAQIWLNWDVEALSAMISEDVHVFCKLPPYSSWRVFILGDRNSFNRYPCAACNQPIKSSLIGIVSCLDELIYEVLSRCSSIPVALPAGSQTLPGRG